MFCSTVIPTIARPSLERAVNSVLEQALDPGEFEVIVVNDSGRPLPGAEWQASKQVTVLNTGGRRERIVARNTGAAVARGKFIHFLDDDDWLLPGALAALRLLAERSSGNWLYGSAQLVDRQGQPLIQLHHGLSGNCFAQTMAGEWIPLQTSLIRSEAFFAIGGFTPHVLATQDVDILRRIALHGDLDGIENVVACVGMGRQNSSTDYDRAPVYSRWAREKILNEPGVFARLRDSARTGYLRGRVVRIYLTSLVWNLQRGRGFTALSRGMHGLASVALSGPAIASAEFWRATKGRYESPTFARGFEAAQAQGQTPAMRQLGEKAA